MLSLNLCGLLGPGKTEYKKEDDVNAVIKSMWKDKRRQNCNRYKCIGFPVYFLVVSREKYSVQLSAEY